MDLGSIPSAAPAVKTEWRQNPERPDPKVEAKDMSFGARLNQLSGISNEKNLYQEGKNTLSKESYLKMMMEQVKNQDPFSPMKSDQFTQNIAMMSQLEQQVNMNKTLERMLNQNNNMQIAALQLVGKTVFADRSAIYHEKDKLSQVQFKLPQDASELKLEVMDATGETVRTLNLGTQNQGEVKAKWDGFYDNGMPAPTGRYSYKVVATGMDQKEIPMSLKAEGRVTGVTSVQGVTFLLVGDQKIALNEVETIKEGGLEKSAEASVLPKEAKTAAVNVPPAETGTKAPAIDVSDEAVERLMGQENSKSPLEKPHLNELMPILFR